MEASIALADATQNLYGVGYAGLPNEHLPPIASQVSLACMSSGALTRTPLERQLYEAKASTGSKCNIQVWKETPAIYIVAIIQADIHQPQGGAVGAHGVPAGSGVRRRDPSQCAGGTLPM